VFDSEDLGATLAEAHGAVKRATANCAAAMPAERDLTEALQFRYPESRVGESWQ